MCTGLAFLIQSLSNANSIVTIAILQDGKKTYFSIHKSYLTAYSHYFKAALNGPFTEAQTLSFEFKDVSPSVMDIFVSWAYTQKIVDSAGSAPVVRNLIDLWIMADRFQVPRLQNEALEAMNGQASQLNRSQDISFFYVYENTVDESPLRLFLAALSSQTYMKEAKTIDEPENYPHQMLIDMFNWATTHQKKLTKFTQTDLEKFFVEQHEVIRYPIIELGDPLTPDQSNPSLRKVGSPVSPGFSPILSSSSPSGSFTFAGGF